MVALKMQPTERFQRTVLQTTPAHPRHGSPWIPDNATGPNWLPANKPIGRMPLFTQCGQFSPGVNRQSAFGQQRCFIITQASSITIFILMMLANHQRSRADHENVVREKDRICEGMNDCWFKSVDNYGSGIESSAGRIGFPVKWIAILEPSAND